MNYITTFRLVSLFLLFLSSLPAISQQQVSIGGTPDWVKPLQPDYRAKPKDGTTGGYYHLLINNQEHIPKQTTYSHLAIAILSNDGIQYMSDLTLSYDPSYQKLIIHTIKILRGSEIINKLDLSKIRTIQREQSMDRFLYDGSLSAVINLDDVRVGDVLEYAYSIVGYNPVMNGHYSGSNYFEYSIPYEKNHLRIITPNTKEYSFQYVNGEVPLHSEKTKTENMYAWEASNVDAVLVDNEVPSWYDPYKRILISDFSSWKDVVQWALPYYSPSKEEKQKVVALSKQHLGNADGEDYIVGAIRFVQDDIRYLGFESGLNSHKPHDPSRVFEQRFGDCKDKSYLLSVLLNAKGIEAAPVLVNSSYREYLNPNFVSPYAFDHCIVQLQYNGKNIYIDPTISNQGGDLEHIYFPKYGKGLVIKDGSTSLVDLGEVSFSKTEITETISFSEPGGKAMLRVETNYKGGDADPQRAYFTGKSIESVQKDYENYYSNLYPDIKYYEPIEYEDDREANTFTVVEAYEIENFWKDSPSMEGQIYSEIYPLGIESLVNVSNKSLNRSAPYYLRHPVSYHHTTVIEFPEFWSVPKDNKDIENEYYAYHYKVSYADQEARIEHNYTTFNNHLPAEMTPTFVKDHEAMMNNLTYNLTYHKGLTSSGDGFSVSIVSILIVLLSLGVAIFLAVQIFIKYDPPAALTDLRFSKNIGGWLILVAIGLIVSPIRVLYDVASTPEFFNKNLWTIIVSQNYWILLFVTAAELIYNVFLIVFLILILILFFQRRTSLPRVISIYFGASLLFTIMDYILIHYVIEAPIEDSDQEAIMGVFRGIIAAAIWIPYFNISSRVTETFVERYQE